MTPEQIAAIKAQAENARGANKAITGAHISYIQHATSIEVAKAIVALKAAAQKDIPDLLSALEASEAARVKAEQERDDAQKALLTVQNAAKTLAHSRNSELQHRRENAGYDHKLRAEHDSLIERDALMTDRISALEVERDTLKKALTEISKSSHADKDPQLTSENSWGNYDDAFSDGCRQAEWELADIARRALEASK